MSTTPRFHRTSNEKSLRKGLRLLEILAFSPKPRTVSELAQEAEIGASNVHRLLTVLTELGYVQQDGPRAGYFATPWLNELGTAVADRIDLRQLLAPHLRDLNEATQEAVGIAIWRDGGTSLIARLESPQPVRMYTWLGSRIPSHRTSGGQILLANRPHGEIEQYLAANFPPAPNRDRTLATLRELLTRVRAERVAMTRDVWMPGLSGVAVPLFHGVEVVASLNVSGPSERFRGDRTARLIAQLRKTAAQMERAMSGGGAGQHTDATAPDR